MCQTVAFLLAGGEEIAVLEDVVTILPQGGAIRMINLFGEEKVVRGRIKFIDLLAHRVIIVGETE